MKEARKGEVEKNYLVNIMLPKFQPLAIWFHDKACSCSVLVNFILLCLFVIPAIIHAIWYCFMRS
ncbi:unnamed protein product [Heligmosomoides polygyrus]|uniref:Protein SNA4 n=1 Tax=Heligmosomoides polygyrus TaxID=6339 RepID=A0A183GG54_HELPZ|nr:unnamed protein product [Heligmosomoides polygyrus]